MICTKCGKPSVYKAFKCNKCEKVSLYGAVPNDFGDRCPECKFSQMEADRKAAAATAASPARNTPVDREAQKEERRKRKRLDELEDRIAKLDAEIASLDERMAREGFFDDHEASSKALEDRRRLVAEQESAWAEVGNLEG